MNYTIFKMDFCEKKKKKTISHSHIPTKDIRIDYRNYEFYKKRVGDMLV